MLIYISEDARGLQAAQEPVQHAVSVFHILLPVPMQEALAPRPRFQCLIFVRPVEVVGTSEGT